ncbi:MAG: undecaprenyl-diphosphate phosphatase [Armatimonadetes bacterium]|nr:undecaprenyl-diphosphate phosphatase [Armatimonadota bacterium]MDW8028158.1 undecaprenyl-diphosphate phosphatase [Armatimonadota bacterium]
MESVTFLQLIFLAILQGLTEFLPVSSSGHLALAEHWMGIPESVRLSVTVFLHFGTLVALLSYFRNELVLIFRGIFKGDDEGRKLLLFVIIANIATASIALSLERKVEEAFGSPKFVAIFLLLTASLLFLSEQISSNRKTDQPLNWWRALLVGVAQGLAVFPGLSRSGTTIAAGLISGLGREQAGRFAFVVGIPAMLGANLLEAKDVASLNLGFGSLFIASLLALGVGWLAIHWTLKFVQSARLRWFSIYCLIVALVAWFIG